MIIRVMSREWGDSNQGFMPLLKRGIDCVFSANRLTACLRAADTVTNKVTTSWYGIHFVWLSSPSAA